jgi:hypothetical protein
MLQVSPDVPIAGLEISTSDSAHEEDNLAIDSRIERQRHGSTSCRQLFLQAPYASSLPYSLKQIILKQLVQARSEQALSACYDPIFAVAADGHVYFTNRKAETLLHKLKQDRLP